MHAIADNPEPSERLARLWMEVQPSVLSFICASIPRFYDAEDVLQEVAVEVAKNFSQDDPERPFVAWAIGIAKFKIAAFYRRNQSDAMLWDALALEGIAQAHVHQQDSLAQVREAMDACLRALPQKSQSLLRMRYVEELRSPEIARRIHSTHASVRVTLNRIRNRLLKCIEARLAQGVQP